MVLHVQLDAVRILPPGTSPNSAIKGRLFRRQLIEHVQIVLVCQVAVPGGGRVNGIGGHGHGHDARDDGRRLFEANFPTLPQGAVTQERIQRNG